MNNVGDAPSNWASVGNKSGAFQTDDSNLEAYVAQELSLQDHLTEQLNLGVQDTVDRMIGHHLIDMVDEAGYLGGSIDELAQRLGCPSSRVHKVLSQVQKFDPPGIFARGLRECLALQLQDQNRWDPMISGLLDNLDLLARHDLKGLRKALGVDADELAEMIIELKQLDPKPGLKFGSSNVQAIVPDVFVRPASDGSWIVELNNDTLPRVLLDRTYYTRVSNSTRTTDDKQYIQDCLQTANWLIKSLDQRARTILKVSEEIVRQQDGFFMKGVEHLRPLNLRTVADAISMHESTISRVTSNKYMATPRGILELKFFFTSAISSSQDGDAHSSESVRHRIKSLIDNETAKSILSDDKIVEMLRAEGIEIARRTVAKYRVSLRIPSSVQRRREKRLLESV